jgi:choline dehydrogenase-like flavoprotein/uncharacterized protein YbjT (DUF2867 family)
MRIDDLRQLDDGADLDADVCVVGSGPAGWAIATELSGSGLRVVIAESGGLDREPASEALNAIHDVGTPTFNGRTRALGGTSRTWFGRCIPLAGIDLERRPWVPASGWPLTARDLDPYVARAAERLGATLWSDGERPPPRGWPAPLPAIDPSRLSAVWWQDTVPLDSAAALARERSSGVRVLLHATVTQLVTDGSAKVLESVEVACAPDRRATIRTRLAILCAGGLENARILLYSDRVRPAGLGNDRDLVGRYLMDHPRDPAVPVRIDPRDERPFRRLFGPHRLTVATGRRHGFRLGFALDDGLQRSQELLHTAAIVEEIGAEDDPVAAILRLRDGDRGPRRADARRIAAAPLRSMRAVRAMARDEVSPRAVQTLGFELISEQLPDPDSRVRLARERDRLGLPLAEIDWRTHELELCSQVVLAHEIAAALPGLGLARPALAEWLLQRGGGRPRLTDGCHPAGTTRMARDPGQGVVDGDCRVHGMENLYVAGSSVFPTAGHANPTLTIVALAIRLADHVRATLAPRRPAPPAGTARPPQVAVTGATGFIGGRLTEALLDGGARVTCLVRGAGRGRAGPRARAARVDMRSPSEVRAAIGGAGAVFHCAYDWTDESFNLAALRSLIDACVDGGVRLVHLSSFMVYHRSGAGVRTERAPRVAGGAGYPAVKAALESEIRRAVSERGLAATILQPTNVYGPHSRMWTERPADMLRFGTVVLPAPGDGPISLVHVDDLVAAMLAAWRRDRDRGESFIIDGADTPSWREFYAAVAAVIGVRGAELRDPAEIRRESTVAARLRRLAGDPAHLAHALWLRAPSRRAMERAVGAAPPAVRSKLVAFLDQPCERWLRARHLPDLEFTRSRVTYSSEKARRLLGYEPRLDFASGMAETAPYLEQYVRFAYRS